jgi:hypothetical protein
VQNIVVQCAIENGRVELAKVHACILKKFALSGKTFDPSYDVGVFNEKLELCWSNWDRTAPVTCGWVYIRNRECTYIEIDLTKNA